MRKEVEKTKAESVGGVTRAHTHRMFTKNKEEKGSITLFVLIAVIFFIILLVGTFVIIKNKEIMAQKEIEEIKLSYSQGTNNVDETYTNLANENDKYVTQGQIQEIIKKIYPVGSIYISENNANPGNFLGGTWEAYGQGRTLIGAGSGTDANGTTKEFVEKTTGGEYTHKLTVAEMPSHNHINTAYNVWAWKSGANGKYIDKNATAGGSTTFSSGWQLNVGGNGRHNNIQPYIVTYMWKRIK